MIERGLQSLNSIVASLRRDVDALEKRPICRGGSGGGTPPPPVGVSYGFVYGVKEATKGVHRITQSEIGPEIVQLPTSSDLSVLFEGTTSQQSVFTLYDGGRWRLVDLAAGQVGGALPMPLQNGNVNDATWYGQPSYVGTHTGGRRYAVVHQRKWGEEGAVVCADVGTGEVLAELRGNLPDVQRLDVQNPDSAPLVVRQMSGGNGYQVYLVRGAVFEHQYDLPMPGVDLFGSRWDGAYFTGLFRVEGGYGTRTSILTSRRVSRLSLTVWQLIFSGARYLMACMKPMEVSL